MLSELRIGVIVTTHGLRGEVKVQPTTEAPERFLMLKKLRARSGGRGMRALRTEESRELEIESVRFQKDMLLVKFKGLDRIEDVQSLRGYELLIKREEAIPLPEGKYFIGDYLGLSVLTEEGESLGKIRSVLETAANNVFLVQNEAGREYMIPNTPNCVLEARPEEGYIRIHVLEGLLDL